MRAYLSSLRIVTAAAGCVGAVAAQQVKLPPPQAAMERQIENAVNVGDGDYDIRLLRLKMVQQPDNLEVRLALAKRYEAVGSTELALEHYRLAAVRFPESP